MINFLRRYFATDSVSRELRTNFIHLYLDISWWGLYTGGTVAFLSIYAARIGATPEQIGLLTAVPALLATLLALPLGRVVRRITAWRASFIGALISRLMLLVYAVLPALLPEGQTQVWAILVAAALIAAPSTLVGISFNQFFMESVPIAYRGTVVGVRMALFAIINFIATLTCGQLLNALPFPTGYQVVFFIGFVGATMTAYHIWHVRPVDDPDSPPLPASPPATRLGWLPPLDEEGRRYLRVLGILFLFNTTNSTITPLIPEVLVNRLNLPDSTIGIGTAATAMLQFLISLFIAGLTRRMGNRNGTALGAALIAVQALTLALAPDAAVYLLSAIIGGISTGLLLTSQYNYHLQNVPVNERAAWLSWAMMLGNGAILAGALLGPLLAGWLGLTAALIVLAAARLLAGGVIWKWG